MATREVPREKNMGLKSTLVSVSKSIARRGMAKRHCVKSVQIRSFFWSVFFRIRTEYSIKSE